MCISLALVVPPHAGMSLLVQAPDAVADAGPLPPATTSTELCGISLSFLQWFGDYVDPKMSTRDVVEQVPTRRDWEEL